MQQKKLVTVLLEPSLSSAILGFIICLLFIILGLLPIVKSTTLYQEYMNGFNSPAYIIGSSKNGITALTSTIFANKQVNELLFVLFWAIIGLFIYLILTPILTGVKNTVDTVDELTYVNSQKSQVINTFTYRLLLRITIFILWVVLIFVTAKFIIPFCALCIQAGGFLSQITSYSYLATAFIILAATWHVHVIFLRLLLLHVRIYGGEEDVLR
jgi:hypothetical protein